MSEWLVFISHRLHCMVTWLYFSLWSPQCQYFQIFLLRLVKFPREDFQSPAWTDVSVCAGAPALARVISIPDQKRGRDNGNPSRQYVNSISLFLVLYLRHVCFQEIILSSRLLECIVDLWQGIGEEIWKSTFF